MDIRQEEGLVMVLGMSGCGDMRRDVGKGKGRSEEIDFFPLHFAHTQEQMKAHKS